MDFITIIINFLHKNWPVTKKCTWKFCQKNKWHKKCNVYQKQQMLEKKWRPNFRFKIICFWNPMKQNANKILNTKFSFHANNMEWSKNDKNINWIFLSKIIFKYRIVKRNLNIIFFLDLYQCLKVGQIFNHPESKNFNDF